MDNKSRIFGALLVNTIYETYDDYHMLTDIVEYAIENNDEKLINYIVEFIESDEFDVDILDNYIMEISGITPTRAASQKASADLADKQLKERTRLASWYTHKPNIAADIKAPDVPKEPGPIRQALNSAGAQKVKGVLSAGLSSVGKRLNKYEGVNKAYNYVRGKASDAGVRIGRDIQAIGRRNLDQAKASTMAGQENEPLHLSAKGVNKIRLGRKIVERSKQLKTPVPKTP